MLERSEPPSGTAPADRDALAWRMAKLRRYDLNLLLSLHTRNVTQAGDWLGVTQPAMSSDFRRLRQMFKDELLVRYGREYQLTALASALLDPLARAVADLERALTWRSSFDPCVDTRNFSIAISDHVIALLLPALGARLPFEAPNVTIYTRGLSALSTDPVMATDSGEVRSQHRCFSGAYRVVHGIAAEVLYGSKGIQRQVALTTESFALLRGSRMVALVHQRLARQVPGLKLPEPPVPIPEVEESMFWSSSMDRDPGHIWLRELVRGIARSL